MKLSDFVLIPTRVGVFDLAAVADTVAMAKESKKPFAVLLNAVPPARLDEEPSIVTEARHLLQQMGAPVLSRHLSQRAAFSHSLISGEAVSEFAPASAAAYEIGLVWKNIKRSLKSTGVR
jgi:chromosome partitioning protein